MAVKFNRDLTTLVRDLERLRCRVRLAEKVAGSPGRTADVYLENGVVVRWDAYSQRIWADGPVKKSQRTERKLRCLYEGGLGGRLWIASLSQLSKMLDVLGALYLQIQQAASENLAAGLTSPLHSLNPSESVRGRTPAPYSII